MPPKVKIQPAQIIDAALELVRKGGPSALNARAIAAAIGCSTQPIFSNFPTMESLREAVVAAAYACYEETVRREAEDDRLPRYKTYGLGYITFAREEPMLFRMLFADKRVLTSSDTALWTQAVDEVESLGTVASADAERLHTAMWVVVHGIASLVAAERLTYDRDRISAMITDYYMGLCRQYAPKEEMS